jgi:hypothetical protein
MAAKKRKELGAALASLGRKQRTAKTRWREAGREERKVQCAKGCRLDLRPIILLRVCLRALRGFAVLSSLHLLHAHIFSLLFRIKAE